MTADKFIECKNVEWSKWTNWTEKEFKKAMGKIKGQLGYLQKLSIQEGKTFELHSKHSIMKELTEWLIKENIKFYEG